MAAYKRMARILDDQVGIVLNALEEAGLAEDTLFIYTTDHGLAFPGMKCTLTDHGFGVSLIMRGAAGVWRRQGGGRDGPRRSTSTRHCASYCDVEPPAWLQGRSVVPLVAGTVDEINAEIFGEVSYHAGYEPKRAVRTQRWKYIRRFDQWATTTMPNIDNGPSKQYLMDNGLAERKVHAEALYDLIYDPNEACNLVNDPDYAEALAEMRGRLSSWMERTDDPLLRGPVPAPEGRVRGSPGRSTSGRFGTRLGQPVAAAGEAGYSGLVCCKPGAGGGCSPWLPASTFLPGRRSAPR